MGSRLFFKKLVRYRQNSNFKALNLITIQLFLDNNAFEM